MSFLAVGFAPYRIRMNERGAKIPEILPLGTFTWNVSRSNQGLTATPWGRIGDKPVAAQPKEFDTQPLLRYDVHCSHCKEAILVHPFTPPQTLFSCTSAIASLVNPYLQLCHKRDCTNRANLFNSQPSMVFEHQDKIMTNQIAEGGAGLNSNDVASWARCEQNEQNKQQHTYYNVTDTVRERSHWPNEGVTVFAPQNHNVHGLDRVLSPQDMQHEELAFSRLVGMAIGVPCSLLLQGGGIVGGSSSLGGSNQGWSESPEACNRMLLDTCRYINEHLCALLSDVHRSIYGSHNYPSFKIPLTPTVSFEQVVVAYESQIVDDQNISHILDATWGFSLGTESKNARLEKRKAEYVLPFKDKKIAE